MIKKILILFILTSCSSYNPSTNLKILPSNFNDDLSFDDFKIMLIEYANIAPYPNIDE